MSEHHRRPWLPSVLHAMSSPAPAPYWSLDVDVPRCTTSCHYYEERNCGLTGLVRGNTVCEATVDAMGRYLTLCADLGEALTSGRAGAAGAEWMRKIRLDSADTEPSGG